MTFQINKKTILGLGIVTLLGVAIWVLSSVGGAKLAMAAGGVGALAALFFAVGRQLARSRRVVQAQADLRRQLTEMEQSVQERTSDLEIANEYRHYEIAERKKVEERLEQLAAIVESSGDAIIGKTLDGTITSWNGGAERLFGYTTAEAVGRSIAFLLPAGRAGEQVHILDRLNTGERVENFETERLCKDGRKVDVSVTFSPIWDESAKLIGTSSISRDISNQKRAEQMVQWHAYHDPLTGLPNRALLHDRLHQALAVAERKGEQVAVLIADLDRFKYINDSLGHVTGDLVLREVGSRFAGYLRAEDTLAHMGGDEFTVVLPGVMEPREAARTAYGLLGLLSRPITVDGRDFFVTGSVGISIYPFDGNAAETLLRNADLAMYRAKEQGGNGCHLYTEAMNVAAVERLALENHLRQGIDREEFFLCYQPQLQLADRRVIGAEALVRWRHAELGIVSPDKFIPMSEETGLIVPLGELILRQACRQAAVWQSQGCGFRTSINLSARQLSERNLVGRIRSILDETGVDPRALVFELTESALVANGDTAITVLQELRSLGVCISIDDFGTGYSSLSYLERLPLDSLKIDRSFMQALTGDHKSRAVVRAVIDLGHALGLQVVGEGVETEQQHDVLGSLGCDLVQGFLYSRPAPPEAMFPLRTCVAA